MLASTAISDTLQSITVHSIFFTTATANADLQRLSDDTGGFWYFGNDDNIDGLLDAFYSQAQATDGTNLNQAVAVSTFCSCKYYCKIWKIAESS